MCRWLANEAFHIFNREGNKVTFMTRVDELNCEALLYRVFGECVLRIVIGHLDRTLDIDCIDACKRQVFGLFDCEVSSLFIVND